MLASEAGIVFPALIIHEEDTYYFDAHALKDLNWVEYDLVDSAGQRFLIREFIAVPLPWPQGTPLWRRWLSKSSRPHRYDAKLQPLPPEPFEETLSKLLEKEKVQEGNWVDDGGGADTPDMWDRYRRSKSIAEVLDWHVPPPGSPTVADSIVEDLQKLWLWMTFRGRKKGR